MNSIENLIYPREGRRKNIFFAGKGGVGKTSMACITAVQTSKMGYKTLLMTTDPAAHIGSVLDKSVTDEITKMADSLYAVKIDQKKATEDYKNSLIQDAKDKFDENTVKAMEEELNSPCTEEMAAFQKFIDLAGNDDFQVIVYDTAPTGHTLRLLELPIDWSRQIQLKAGVSAEISEADRVQKQRFDKVISMMKDEKATTFSFVMYPEKTPMIEAYRASKELEEFGIKTQLVVANLVIPEEQAISSFFKNRREMQKKYLHEISQRFEGALLLEVPMFEKEIKGLQMLTGISAKVF